MQVTMTRQDLQGALEYAKNRIIERLVSKSDIQGAVDGARDRIIATSNNLYQQQQQYIRQVTWHTDQQLKRTASVEMRMAALEQEVKSLKQILGQLLDEQRRTTAAVAGMPEAMMASIAKREINAARDQPQYEQPY